MPVKFYLQAFTNRCGVGRDRTGDPPPAGQAQGFSVFFRRGGYRTIRKAGSKNRLSAIWQAWGFEKVSNCHTRSKT